VPEKPEVTLSTVIIQTNRVVELAAFYSGGLGLGRAQATGDDHLGFRLSNLYIGFDQVDDPPKPTESISLWFEVDDVELIYDRFVNIGAGVKYPPSKKPWGGYLAALYDPDGNLFGLSQAG
jgi:predicted enzyme related to lactoylglutathione lyase